MLNPCHFIAPHRQIIVETVIIQRLGIVFACLINNSPPSIKFLGPFSPIR